MKQTYKLIARNASGKTQNLFAQLNPARLRLCSRLRLGATSHLLQFGRGHPSHFYQLCNSVNYANPNPRTDGDLGQLHTDGGGGRMTAPPPGDLENQAT